MSANGKSKSPAVGLDVGTSRIVIARKTNDGYGFVSQLNAFVDVPFSRMTEKTLQKEGIPYTRKNGGLVVHGNESVRFAELLGLELRRPMTGGILNPGEPESTEVIRALVESMVGEEDGAGRPLFFSVPAPPIDGEANVTYHEAAIRDLLTAKGFDVHGINEGLAVVYGELEDSNFSGIGVSCGGGLCNVCVTYLSVPVLNFCVPKAGDYIDRSAAAVTGEIPTRVRLEKESAFHFNGSFPNSVHQAITVYYDDMIKSLMEAMRKAFTTASNLPKFNRPLPLVLSGGTAMPAGFAERFEKALRKENLPIQVSEVRMSQTPLESTAKGALVAALAEI